MSRNSKKLLNYLSEKRDWVTSSDLSLIFGVSKRQIANYVAELNANAIVIQSSPRGYKISPSYSAITSKNHDDLSPRERQRIITKNLCFSADGLNVYDAADELFVSDSSIESDLNILKGKFLQFNLKPMKRRDTYTLTGSENNIRRFIVIELYHNDLEESLIVNASKVIDLIYQMYLKAKISYEHDIRVEEYPFAREAIREAVYNAIAHNCYMYGTPIQIRVMDDAITISNSCILPEGWTVDTLMEPHESKPYNPDIARVFYRAGFIENWGQGIQKICDECKGIGAELPVYELTGTTLRIRFKALESALIDQPKVPKDQPDTLGDTLADSIITLIMGNPQITQSELADATKVSVPSIKRTMKILSDNGKIVRKGGKRYGYWEVN